MNGFEITQEGIKIADTEKARASLDHLVYEAVFTEDQELKNRRLTLVKEVAKALGAIPASIFGLYKEMAREFLGFTVPAINIRGLTYDFARTVFRVAISRNVGAVIFEIARSEMGYTKQRPLEYASVVTAAAAREGYKGPVFIQGDHFQFNRKAFLAAPEKEKQNIIKLINEALEAEFYQIDIDASTLVILEKDSLREQQHYNSLLTAEMTDYIREHEPEGVTVTIGGEIGEIGGENSTPEELRAFMEEYLAHLKRKPGISKISVQTGTAHGGVVLPDGSVAKVAVDFDTLKTLSEIARKEFGLAGAVQHGASTLPDEMFHLFPEVGCCEIHLATGFQNLIYDHPALPEDFRQKIYSFLKENFKNEWKEGMTEAQFIYKVRKKGFGPFKKEWWDLAPEIKEEIMASLAEKFNFLFEKLKVVDTEKIVNEKVQPKLIKKLL
ncbi:class II fructose-bisphosphate aldolase [Thermodesulfatator autotrophicus]|uniref:Aldolase n=1 Tax=Thermodesulfatator autotrophicus TaxID=1795632 RepID=A0A177E7U0_9BACT|nr:class II fructose-bisphosphate aldolase [Thermodesulfatator autotrophicus]OAG27561.1 aldolase [Thermodesulfatator autotrophicus]